MNYVRSRSPIILISSVHHMLQHAEYIVVTDKKENVGLQNLRPSQYTIACIREEKTISKCSIAMSQYVYGCTTRLLSSRVIYATHKKIFRHVRTSIQVYWTFRGINRDFNLTAHQILIEWSVISRHHNDRTGETQERHWDVSNDTSPNLGVHREEPSAAWPRHGSEFSNDCDSRIKRS